MKKIRTYLTQVLLLLCLLSISRAYGQDVGDPAPDFNLETLDGSNFVLSDARDHVVFIFFFGNSCPHCISNGPNTQEDIYNIFMNFDDFDAVGIDTWDGNAASVQNFSNLTGINYTLCLNGSGISSSYQTTYDRIIVVDKQGIIQFKSTANATKSVTAMAFEVISNLLEGPTGIGGDEMEKELLVYPNPAGEMINIIMPQLESSELELTIVNISGKTLYQKNLSNLSTGNLIIPVEWLSPGLYYLRLVTPEGTGVSKFVVR